jgi:hypothetical protein
MLPALARSTPAARRPAPMATRVPPRPAFPAASPVVHGRRSISVHESLSPLTVTVRGARGPVSLPVASALLPFAWDLPPSCHRARLAPLLSVAAAVMLPNVASRCKTIERVLRVILAFAAWCTVPVAEITGDVLVAYAVARSCPPVDVELPEGWGPNPVLPTTVKTELGALRSAAKMGVAEAIMLLGPLTSPRLASFLRCVGANVHRLKTSKKALMWSIVRDYVTPIIDETQEAIATCEPITLAMQTNIRDAFALVLGFTTGARCRELVDLLGDDIVYEDADPARPYIEVTFRKTKTRSTPLGTHEPFRSVVTHPLALALWVLFDDVCGWPAGERAWVRYSGSTADVLSRSWYTTLVKKLDPACSPHCMRVGLATELWACGCSPQEIMTAGRWSSAAAVLYIIGSLDSELAVADRIGAGGLRYDGTRLRGRGLDVEGFEKPQPAAVALWLRLNCSAAAAA